MKYSYIVFALLSLSSLSCIYKNVDTFEKYCDHINHHNETQAYGWDKEKIKEDFVKFYNNVILENVAYYNLGGASIQDSVVQFLYKNDLAGVKQNGDDLLIFNCFLYSNNDPIVNEFKVPIEHTFKGFCDGFDSLLKNRFKNENNSTIQHCIFAAVGAFYKRIIIQGSTKEEKSIIINIDFEKYK